MCKLKNCKKKNKKNPIALNPDWLNLNRTILNKEALWVAGNKIAKRSLVIYKINQMMYNLNCDHNSFEN
jgi:hypothetical protein